MYEEFDVTIPEPGADWVAEDNGVRVILEPTTDDPGKMRHRNAHQRNMKTGEVKHLRALFAELNGVRVYLGWQDGQLEVLMTTRDVRL